MTELKPENIFKFQTPPSHYTIPDWCRYVTLMMARQHLTVCRSRSGGLLDVVEQALAEIEKELFEVTRDAGERYLEDFLSRTLGKLDDGPGIKP